VNNLFYMSNALDDVTRLERCITSDSPAASRKIFLLCEAMRKSNVRTVVISMGRGKQDGSGRYFRCIVRRINGIPVIYLPFLHLPILSELVSLFSIASVLCYLYFKRGTKAVLFYNRSPAYLLGLVMARLLGFKTVLDLEDGEILQEKSLFRSLKSKLFSWFFDAFCSGGAILACSALENNTGLRPTYCCYGTSETSALLSSQSITPVCILLSGTVSFDTGGQLLVDVIQMLREESPTWAKNIQFEITGKGDCMSQFQCLAEDVKTPIVIVHGRITNNEYHQMLTRTQVGLALKPNLGKLANTTFPSKVIEFASHRILVVSTDISDVRKVLSNGAIYLTNDDPRLLIDKLRWIVENREQANNLALRGASAVNLSCAPEKVGLMLKQFIFAPPLLVKK
jgi:glycosyltransferase involved in cell wall biosynthesis